MKEMPSEGRKNKISSELVDSCFPVFGFLTNTA